MMAQRWCNLQTEYGKFTVTYYQKEEKFCLSVAVNRVPNAIPIVRFHSSCLFGESFSALGCDCKQQLDSAMALISHNGRGAVIYRYNEGRGAGLEKKIMAMSVEERLGLSTAEAYHHLDLPLDSREFTLEIEALHELGYDEIVLVTANPRKIEAVKDGGIRIVRVISPKHKLSALALQYVLSKQGQLGHLPVYSKEDFEP